jgi:hypothetical protein
MNSDLTCLTLLFKQNIARASTILPQIKTQKYDKKKKKNHAGNSQTKAAINV